MNSATVSGTPTTNIVRLAGQKLPAKDQKQIIRNRFAKCSDVLEFGQWFIELNQGNSVSRL